MNFQELSEHIVVKEALLKQRSSKVEYENYLKYNGWNVVGSGSYGTVFGKPDKNYVLKVYDDAGYDTFLKFLEKNQNNPHLPKIKRTIIDTGNGRPLGLVAIEKLQRLGGRILGSRYTNAKLNIIASFSEILYTQSPPARPFDEMLDELKDLSASRNADSMKEIKRWGISRYRDTYKTANTEIKRLDYLIESNLPILKTLYDIYVYLVSGNMKRYFDLHGGNFMIRPSTNEIVITDPLT